MSLNPVIVDFFDRVESIPRIKLESTRNTISARALITLSEDEADHLAVPKYSSSSLSRGLSSLMKRLRTNKRRPVQSVFSSGDESTAEDLVRFEQQCSSFSHSLSRLSDGYYLQFSKGKSTDKSREIRSMYAAFLAQSLDCACLISHAKPPNSGYEVDIDGQPCPAPQSRGSARVLSGASETPSSQRLDLLDRCRCAAINLHREVIRTGALPMGEGDPEDRPALKESILHVIRDCWGLGRGSRPLDDASYGIAHLAKIAGIYCSHPVFGGSRLYKGYSSRAGAITLAHDSLCGAGVRLRLKDILDLYSEAGHDRGPLPIPVRFGITHYLRNVMPEAFGKQVSNEDKSLALKEMLDGRIPPPGEMAIYRTGMDHEKHLSSPFFAGDDDSLAWLYDLRKDASESESDVFLLAPAMLKGRIYAIPDLQVAGVSHSEARLLEIEMSRFKEALAHDIIFVGKNRAIRSIGDVLDQLDRGDIGDTASSSKDFVRKDTILTSTMIRLASDIVLDYEADMTVERSSDLNDGVDMGTGVPTF